MLIQSRRPGDVTENDVTPENLYLNRRIFMLGTASLAAGMAFPAAANVHDPSLPSLGANVGKSRFSTTETLTSYRDITTYNNFYEFGYGKSDPVKNSGSFRTRPWTVSVDGEVAKPQTFDIERLLKLDLEERIYRLRCVEAWSMVIPWVGFPLRKILAQVEPSSRAKYLSFETLHDPKQMPGQKRSVLKWPYREGLRLDEAMHPLTFIAVGLYGRVLPNQNGAPLRLVVPWKYGFKSIKSITRIRLTATEPKTSWNMMAPDEYGFYANVNPTVDHPRWSQGKERRIGEFRRRPTLMFNGYGDEVANLYAGMNLKRFY